VVVVVGGGRLLRSVVDKIESSAAISTSFRVHTSIYIV
jgi:hypothetical protein